MYQNFNFIIFKCRVYYINKYYIIIIYVLNYYTTINIIPQLIII